MLHRDTTRDDGSLPSVLFLPSQVDRSRMLSPEQKLYDAMLWEALRDIRASYQPKRQSTSIKRRLRRRQDALDWINGKLIGVMVSFRFVTDALNINPQRARTLIAKMIRSWERTNGKTPIIVQAQGHSSPHVT